MVRSDSGLDSYLKCGDCGAIQLLFKPLPHQVAFMADKAKFRLYAGGYGSGKTTSSVQAVIKHILTTPNGTTLMTAPTVPQLEQTSQKEFFEKFPTELITNYSKQKGVVDIINGHRVLFRASDDDGKLRSLNLSCWHMEEGSHIKYEIFVQLQTRLRSSATKNHIGIISSNPDTGWIKEEFLLKSNIHGGDVKYYQRE
jgi:phage terminase large subunit